MEYSRGILKNQKPIDAQIQSAEKELAALDEKRKELQARIRQLKVQKQSIAEIQLPFDLLSQPNVTNDSNEGQKIALFRSLFRGREDVYPRRFESKRTGEKWLPAGLPERVDQAYLSKIQN